MRGPPSGRAEGRSADGRGRGEEGLAELERVDWLARMGGKKVSKNIFLIFFLGGKNALM